nr:7779_t:CDS:2 [Entrophospora candida]
MRLKKWFQYFSEKEKISLTNDLTTLILARKRSMCNVIEYGEHKVIYKRYASLYFAAGIDWEENELYILEVIHRYVQILDEFFGNVCEMDIIFNFDKAYYALDELFIEHLTTFEQTCQLDIITRNIEETVK